MSEKKLVKGYALKGNRTMQEVFILSLKHRMVNEGMNQTQLARTVGVSSSYMSELMNCKKRMDFNMAETLANAVGMHIVYTLAEDVRGEGASDESY